MANILTNLTENFAELTLTKKLFLGLVLAGGFALISVLWLWTQKPDFRVLYTNLSSEDAGAVIGKFKELNVPYQFSENGSAILVPSERVHELRLQLASEGLPQGGGVGFEIFDQTSFGTTEFSQKLNYRRALQGELARTITQIDEISKARIHLVIPERALFSEQQERSQAAIVVHLKPGRHLTNRQVQGITHLVASSVEGLTPDGVTVVDSKGKVRTKDSEGSSPFLMSHSQIEYQKNIEKNIEQNIQTMLARVVGPQKAVVRVSSKLDLRQVEVTEERYDPENQVIRSEQRSQEDASESSNSKNASGGAGGIPGVASNSPSKPETKTGGGAGNQNSSRMKNEVINYEISKSVSRIIEPFGTIKQLSVAALIDGTYETITNDAGETSKKYLPRSEEEMKKLMAIVKKAMGYSPERNDQVEVVNIPFKSNAELDEPLPPAPMVKQIMQWMPLVRQIIGPLLILLVLFSVIKPIIKTAMMTPPQQTPVPALAGVTSSGIEAGMPGAEGQSGVTGPGGLAGVTGPAGSRSDLPQLEEPKNDREGLPTQEDMIQLAQENPQIATQLVKKWIQES